MKTIKYCLCGCKSVVKGSNDWILGHHRRGVDGFINKSIPAHHLCQCGYCDIMVASDKRFVLYHHRKYPKAGLKLCECNCGEVTAPGKKYKRGHNGRGKHPTEETLKKMRKPKSEQGRLNIKAGANRPEVRSNRSRLTKEYLSRPEVKEKRKEYNALPEVKRYNSEIQKIAQNRPEVITKRAAGQKKAMALPGYHEKKSAIAKECQNRPEVKAKQVAIQKIVQNDPEIKERAKVAARIANEKPEVKERRSKSAIELCKKPGVKERRAVANRKLWKTPGYRESRSGEFAANWQGGKSYEIYPEEFDFNLKLCIRERDNFTCRGCGNNHCGKLHVHHIDYDKRNCSPDNLITLCISCHMKTNCGKENRVYWTSFYRDKVVLLSELDRYFGND